MSLAHRSMNRPCRWSSQFGLYKYKEQELDLEWSHKNDVSYKKRLQIIFLLTVVLISVLVVVLVLMDVTSGINDKVLEKKNRSGRQTNEDTAHADALHLDSNTEITITKENISNTDIADITTENYDNEKDYDEQIAESKIFESGVSQPSPFQRNARNSFPQLSNYKNSEKFESLDQLVMYMNHRLQSNNINANPNRRIKFSGVYFHPVDGNKKIQNRKLRSRKQKEQFNESPTGFKNIYPIDRNQRDPFYSYKPKQPGDINLLADKLFRFSPNRTSYLDNTEASEIKPCDQIIGDSSEVSKLMASDRARVERKQKPLSVMLDIYPMDDQDEEMMAFPPHLKAPVTTRKPKIKYMPNYYNHPQMNPYYYYNGYPPNYFKYNRQQISNRTPFPNVQNANQANDNVPTKMLLQLNLYPRKKIVKQFKFGDDTYDIIDRKFEESDNGTIRRSMIGRVLEKYNKDHNVVKDDHLDDVTMEDLENGYGFRLPGPKLIKSDYPDGMSESVVRLLSLPNNLTKNRELGDGGENQKEKEKEIPNNVPLSHRVANNSFFVLPLDNE